MEAAANLGRDLPPCGEERFPLIPFRYSTASGTGLLVAVEDRGALPNDTGFCAAAPRLPAAQAQGSTPHAMNHLVG